MGFILFLLFVVYFVYNIIQVDKAMKGLRPESCPFLFFCAAGNDLYYWIKSKL